MKIARFLFSTAPGMTLLTAAVCLLSGLFNGSLVVVVHRALTGAEFSFVAAPLGLVFLAACAGKLLTGYCSEVMLTRSAQQALAALRLELVRKLQHVPFQRFEQLGRGRVLSTLTDDVNTLSHALYTLPAFVINLTVIVGAAAYLVYLSAYTLLSLTLFTLIGGLVYRAVLRRAHDSIAEARIERDRLNEHFVALVHGMKELKLHRPRREAYTDGKVSRSSNDLMSLDVSAHTRFILAHSTSHAFLFALIGIVIFLLPSTLAISSETISGYVLTALYLMGPLSGAVGALPVFAQAEVALNHIEELGLSFEQHGRESCRAGGHESASFELIEVRGLRCAHAAESAAEQFVMGPVDLLIRPGELIFLTGGNGSGKSTLAKLLTGLYEPDAGTLLWNGRAVTEENRDEYRQLFSAVFADFYLFESLLGLSDPELDARAARYLCALALDQKVRVEGGKLSTIKLSQGQRKRLALLTAYLEDRPIYLFDEWAADQDPSFKAVFYTQLLPELKAAGKTVIVISHDDRYFHLADRHFEMREGQLFELPPSAAPAQVKIA